MKKPKLPRIQSPIDRVDLMMLIALGLISAGTNEMFGRGPAMLVCGGLLFVLAAFVARGHKQEVTE